MQSGFSPITVAQTRICYPVIAAGRTIPLMRLASVALLTVLIADAAAPQPRPTGGMFSRLATPVGDLMWSENGTKQVRIPSPNRSHTLVAEALGYSGVQLILRRGGTTIWKEKVRPGVGIEVNWSPDSRAFFATTSDAGRKGWYGTVVYLIEDDNVRKVNLSPAILSAFGHPVKCGWEEPPNVAGVRWVVPSKSLFVAAEIIHHSNCDSYGTFRAYEVSLPDGRITKSYGQIEAKRLFRGDLGWELVDAPDQCIKQPKSCWVPANHPRAAPRN